MSSLRAGGKKLNGSIPPGLGGLSALTSVDWVGLGLTGTIPAELGNLSSLTSLKLSSNKLSGEIPATLGNLTSLEKMYLGNNDLTGPIPDLSRIAPLHVLILRNNKLSGEIPAWLGGMTHLKRLVLKGNQLTGDIPHELGQLPDGRMGLAGGDGEIRLSGNGLTGCIPPSLRTVPIHDLALLPLSDCPLPAMPAGRPRGDARRPRRRAVVDRPGRRGPRARDRLPLPHRSGGALARAGLRRGRGRRHTGARTDQRDGAHAGAAGAERLRLGAAGHGQGHARRAGECGHRGEYRARRRSAAAPAGLRAAQVRG